MNKLNIFFALICVSFKLYAENPCLIMYPGDSVSWGIGAAMIPLNNDLKIYNFKTNE